MSKKNRAFREKANGNTKHSPKTEESTKVVNTQGKQLVKWFFTFNNYFPADIDILETKFRTICNKYIFQEELGENGTPHLQGCIFLKKKMRWSEFFPKDYNNIHWEEMRNEKASIAYCCKDETRVGNIFKWGFPRELDIITNLFPWQETIYRKCLLEPDKRKIIWIYDPKGNNGKTALCKFLTIKVNAISATSGSAKDIACILAMCVKNGKNLNDLTTFIFHYARTSEHISYKAIESVKDGYITSTKYESGTMVFNCPHCLVFSNELPDIDKLTKDRWEVYTLNDNKELILLSLQEIKYLQENDDNQFPMDM